MLEDDAFSLQVQQKWWNTFLWNVSTATQTSSELNLKGQ